MLQFHWLSRYRRALLQNCLSEQVTSFSWAFLPVIFLSSPLLTGSLFSCFLSEEKKKKIPSSISPSPPLLYPSAIRKEEGRNYFNFLAIGKAVTKKALLGLHTNFFSAVPSDSQSLRPTGKLSRGLGKFHIILKHFPVFNIIQFTYPDHINYN